MAMSSFLMYLTMEVPLARHVTKNKLLRSKITLPAGHLSQVAAGVIFSFFWGRGEGKRLMEHSPTLFLPLNKSAK